MTCAPYEQESAVFWEKTGLLLSQSHLQECHLVKRPHTAVKIWRCACLSYASQSMEQEALFSVSLHCFAINELPVLPTADFFFCMYICKDIDVYVNMYICKGRKCSILLSLYSYFFFFLLINIDHNKIFMQPY